MTTVLFILLAIVSVGECSELFSDKDNADLPRLFHLDDHDRCLLQTDGLYCLAIFELSPIKPSPVYENIKKYSSNPFAFNRSRLHRGYCVSERCPSTDRNVTLRFEKCVNKRARRYALNARLLTLNYCTTQQQFIDNTVQPPDSAQQLFLQVVYAILVLNVVGTVYDFATGNREKKNGLLTAWSVCASWRRLTASYDNGDPRLKALEAIHGQRVVSMLITIYAHACVHHFQYYVTTPNMLENLTYRFDGVVLANGTSLIQLFVMISSFLTAYNMLLYSQTRKLSFVMLPVFIIKRIIRIAPVHLLIVGFAATWWPEVRSGALSGVIRETSAICRRKFWTHAFSLNNVVEKRDICLLPSWFLPVDMHLFILASALTIVMSRRRHQALRLYLSLFLISAVFCGLVSYVYEYQALIYFSVPENIRGLFKNSASFSEFYTSTWGALPACFLGLFTAHLHLELQERKYDWNKYKWLKHLQLLFIPAIFVWVILLGKTIRNYKQPLVTAVYIAIDRPLFCGFMFLMIMGSINIRGPLRKFYGWRGWRVPARLSLPLMLCHWVVAGIISARPVTYHTSVFDVSIDYMATLFYSHLVAVPISLLLEIPVQRFFSQFF